MAIGAAQHDILTDVHGRVFEAFVALDASLAFVQRVFVRLVDPIFGGQCVRICLRQIARNGNGRAEAGVGSSKSEVPNSNEAPKSKN